MTTSSFNRQFDSTSRRETQLEKLLQSDDIAPHVLKAACLHGIPDNDDLRAEAWRTLLGVVDLTADNGHSNENNARKASKAKKRKQYYDLASDLLAGPSSASVSAHPPEMDELLPAHVQTPSA